MGCQRNSDWLQGICSCVVDAGSAYDSRSFNCTYRLQKESDQDYHLVLQDDSGTTIIAEIPDPSCVGSGSPFADGVSNSRSV